MSSLFLSSVADGSYRNPLWRCGPAGNAWQPLFWPAQWDKGRRETRRRTVRRWQIWKYWWEWNKRRQSQKEVREKIQTWQGVEGLESRQSEGTEVARWLAVRLQGSWQARLHATLRKLGSSFDTAPPQETGLWHRKEIQYGAFTMLQPAWEPSTLKYSNNPASSQHATVRNPIVHSWIQHNNVNGRRWWCKFFLTPVFPQFKTETQFPERVCARNFVLHFSGSPGHYFWIHSPLLHEASPPSELSRAPHMRVNLISQTLKM